MAHLIFLSSKASDSMMIMIIPENPTGSQIQIVKKFSSLAPINNFALIQKKTASSLDSQVI